MVNHVLSHMCLINWRSERWIGDISRTPLCILRWNSLSGADDMAKLVVAYIFAVYPDESHHVSEAFYEMSKS